MGTNSLNCVIPTDIKSMVVCDLVLEFSLFNGEGKPEFVVTRSATEGSFDLSLPYVSLNY